MEERSQFTGSVILGTAIGVMFSGIMFVVLHHVLKGNITEIAENKPYELRITVQQEESPVLEPIPMPEPDLGKQEPIPERPEAPQPVRVIEREVIVEKPVEVRRMRNVIDTHGPDWVYSGDNGTRQSLIYHLGTGIHRDKHTLSRLNSMSLKDLRDLHSQDHNDHEAVSSQQVVQQPIKKKRDRGLEFNFKLGGERIKYQKINRNRTYGVQSCPDGQCPVY